MRNFLFYGFFISSIVLNVVQFYVIKNHINSAEKEATAKVSDNPTIDEINQMPTEEKTKILIKKLDESNAKTEAEIEKLKKGTPATEAQDLKSGYAIVIGAFKTKHFIEKNEKTITDLGYKVLRQEATINQKKLTVLMVGLFKDQGMAQITMDVLKEDKAISDKAFLKKIQSIK